MEWCQVNEGSVPILNRWNDGRLAEAVGWFSTNPRIPGLAPVSFSCRAHEMNGAKSTLEYASDFLSIICILTPFCADPVFRGADVCDAGSCENLRMMALAGATGWITSGFFRRAVR
jgi:hypothetical protein